MSDRKYTDIFENPGAEYRGKPFWSWNGELRADELERQVKVMKEMGLGGYFMHSRAGLITEYLGDEWFELINKTADAGEACGMEAWLYDEDRWPSGSAGGKVTVDPQYRGKSMYLYESAPEKFTGFGDSKEDNSKTYKVYIAKINGIDMYGCKQVFESDDISAVIAEQAPLLESCPGEWKVLNFRIVPDKPNSNYNGTTYIDVMSRKAVDKFIEMTHEEYAKRCGDRIGRSIKGIFTDEPNRGHMLDNRRENDGVISCAVCWTDDMAEEFAERYGYELTLPDIFYRPDGERVKPVKLNFIDLANNLFIERFAMPINEWCNNHGMQFTGHVLHEDMLMCQTVPNGSLMRFYEHMGYPGIDCLTEHNNGYWIVKQLTSAARQLGKKWLLSELYGCTGWQFNLKSHKAVGDWQALFGINLRCQHLSWYTMEGESKRDYPASILHQSPWYHDYALVEDYFARFGFIMSEGKPACDVLMLNPIESLWCQAYLGWASWIMNVSQDIAPYETRYQELFHYLTDSQIDFDYGEEQMMAARWSVGKDSDGKPVLNIGEASYHVVLVSDMLTIRPSTIEILKAFIAEGGKVIFAGQVPEYIDAVKSSVPAELAKQGITVDYDKDQIVEAVRRESSRFVSVVGADGKTDEQVLAQVRADFDGNGSAVVILNTDRNKERKNLTIKLKADRRPAVELWDMETGKRYSADNITEFENGEVQISTGLEAAGTLCFVLKDKHTEALEPVTVYKPGAVFTIDSGEFEFTKDEANVCVLDMCRWKWSDGEFSPECEALKADRQIRDSLGIEHRGGAMLQPWYAKLHDKKQYGQLAIEYDFYIETMPEGDVYLAGERPEFNAYSINGIKLENTDINDFWVDDCFKKMKIPAGALKPGKNTVRIDVTFMRTTNVETVYLVGEFGVRIEDTNKRVLTSLPEKLTLGNTDKLNMPFYTGMLTYRITPDMYKGKIADGDRIMLRPYAKFCGDMRVTALGKTTVIGWDPYLVDVSEAVRAGADIYVTVVGTRRNVFGPLHQIPALCGAYGPENWTTSGNGWTDSYSFLDSGLEKAEFITENK